MKERVRDLTPRPREVVRLISLGFTIPEIAAILDVAPNTVDNQRQAALRTLGVSRSTLLTRLAIEHRIAPIGDKLTRSEKRKLTRKA